MPRVLLADDSKPIRRVVDLTLDGQAIDLEVAIDGSEALRIVDAGFAPDVALVDVHMPGVGGIELCRQLRQRVPGVRVLLLVGTFEPFDAVEGEEAGAVGHLLKPFSADDLRQRVEELLGVEPVAADSGSDLQREDPGIKDALTADASEAVAPAAPSILTGSETPEVAVQTGASEPSFEDGTSRPQLESTAPELALSEQDLDSLARRVAGYLLENLSAESADELFARVVGDEVRKRIDQLEKELADDDGDN